MITSLKRLVVALAVAMPVAALVASPVMAASRTKHHTSVHKVSAHKASHSHKAATPTAS